MGPVASTVCDFIKGQVQFAGDPDTFLAVVKINTKGQHLELEARREPDTELLSTSDIECIEETIKFCKPRSVTELSELTHHEHAWRKAPVNGAMDYEAFIDDDKRIAVENEVLKSLQFHERGWQHALSGCGTASALATPSAARSWALARSFAC